MTRLALTWASDFAIHRNLVSGGTCVTWSISTVEEGTVRERQGRW